MIHRKLIGRGRESELMPVGKRGRVALRDGAARAGVTLFRAGWWDTARPTAVITMHDRTAMGVYQAVAAAGLTVPDDLPVISFDNSDIARRLDPELSNIDLPYFDLGRRAVERLLAGDAEPWAPEQPLTDLG